MPRAVLADTIAAQLRRLTLLLYDTSVPASRLDAAIAPYLAPQVRFTDPWQEGAGRDRYRLGASGFHALFRFTFDISQASVQLAADGRSGRGLIDGVMHLRPLSALPAYPLRTFLVYEFNVVDPATGHFEITAHDEMWSVGDMLAAAPLAGWLYRALFRPAFARGFLAVSRAVGPRRRPGA